jgi:serine/threonine-protein kinase
MPERIDPEGMTEAAPLDSIPMTRKASAVPDGGPPLVAGRYELLGMVGGGAMGTVYRARDRELDELVALKVLRPELARAEGMLERFRSEVKLARRVTHRNVARMYDIGENGGDKFLTMEFIDGEGLASMLERRGMLLPGEVILYAIDICAGLEAAHAANVLHRDLKPENVIIASDGRISEGVRRASELDAWLGAGDAQERTDSVVQSTEETR